MKFKKCMAVLMAATISLSAGSSLVFAETYQETEKAKFAEFIQDYTALYSKQMESYGDAVSADADLYVQLSDTSRALIGMMLPVDISWLDNVGIYYNTTIVDGIEAVVGDIYVNDTAVCTMEVYMDTASMITYIRIPELHDAYLMADMTADVELPEATAASLDVLNDPMALMPDAAALEALLTRYSSVLFDGFGESITSEDTVSVEGIEEACTTYEGQMQQEDAQAFITNLLNTAKDDAELKEIIEEWAPLMEMEGESSDPYQDFQAAIDEALADIADSSATNDGSYISSKIWVDADNNIVGREIGFYENAGAESDIYFKYLTPSTETSSALLVELCAEGESFGISGHGETVDGKLSGTYDFLYNSVVMASVDVTDYVAADTEAGGLNGSYKLSLQPGIGEENYEVLANFDAVIDCVTDMETLDQTLSLTLNMSGAPLGTIGIAAGMTEALELPDFAALPNVLDAASEDDMVTFVTEMDWAPILDNCVSAGMPEDLAALLDQMIYDALYGAEEETEPAV